MNKRRLGLALTLGAVVVAGCSDQTRQEYGQAGNIAGNAIDRDVANGIKVADAAGKAAKRTLKEDEIKSKAESAEFAVTSKIKGALAAADDLHSEHIEVSTLGNQVTLKGTVPSAQEKERSQSIASDIAGPSYKITNTLSVSH